jgi:hypothetical protein
MGGRKDLFTGSNAVPLEIDLDAFVDANVHFGYHLNNRLSFFVKGSNLLGDTYQKWVNYQVQGIQVLAGASYKFDW